MRRINWTITRLTVTVIASALAILPTVQQAAAALPGHTN